MRDSINLARSEGFVHSKIQEKAKGGEEERKVGLMPAPQP
jgi:hypothetical protein